MLVGSPDGDAVVDTIESREKQTTIQIQRDSKWSQSNVHLSALWRKRDEETLLPLIF
jgi:hypothetical protein